MTEPTEREEPMKGLAFRKKPVVIEAVRVEKLMDILSPEWWADAVRSNTVILHGMGKFTREQPWVEVPTWEGAMRGDSGDWIIRGVMGELYPCKPEIFAATYEPVEVETQPSAQDASAEPVAQVYRQSDVSAGVMWMAGYQPTDGDFLYATPRPAAPSARGWIDATLDNLLPEVGTEVLLRAEAYPWRIERAVEEGLTPPRSELHMGECRDSGYGKYLEDYAAPDDDHYVTHWMPHPSLSVDAQNELPSLRWDGHEVWGDFASLGALRKAVAPAQKAVTDEQIRAIFLANGFTIKEGLSDLKPYVYAAARALLASAPAKQYTGLDPVAFGVLAIVQPTRPTDAALEQCRLPDELIASCRDTGDSPEKAERRIRARAAVEAAWEPEGFISEANLRTLRGGVAVIIYPGTITTGDVPLYAHGVASGGGKSNA